MKTKKRIASKLFAALVVLTLISCCFLGTTFARYTTGSSNTASVSVAKWDVNVTAQGATVSQKTTLSFDELSPSQNSDMSTNQSNSTGRKLVAKLTVSEDTAVDVKITVSLGAIKFLNSDSEEVALGTEGIPSYNDCSGVFSIKFYDADTEGNELSFVGNEYTKTVTAGTWLNIYAEVTWTTYYLGNSTAGIATAWTGTNADKLDTWIGENIASVNWDLSYTAVQASELPQ